MCRISNFHFVPSSFHSSSIKILFRDSDWCSNGVFGFDCMPSDDGVCSESKTDTGHECGMYMWFVDLYIGNSHRCCYLTSDYVDGRAAESTAI